MPFYQAVVTRPIGIECSLRIPAACGEYPGCLRANMTACDLVHDQILIVDCDITAGRKVAHGVGHSVGIQGRACNDSRNGFFIQPFRYIQGLCFHAGNGPVRSKDIHQHLIDVMGGLPFLLFHEGGSFFRGMGHINISFSIGSMILCISKMLP